MSLFANILFYTFFIASIFCIEEAAGNERVIKMTANYSTSRYDYKDDYSQSNQGQRTKNYKFSQPYNSQGSRGGYSSYKEQSWNDIYGTKDRRYNDRYQNY